MAKVIIHCPSCKKRGTIEIEENLVLNSTRGITAVNVAELLICEHSFIAYIDKNLEVRSCFTADFTIQLPQITVEAPVEGIQLPDENMINIYLLLLNYSALWLSNVLRCCFYKEKFTIINDVEILNNHIITLLEFMFQSTFDINLTIIKTVDFRKNKRLYKDSIILEKDKVNNDRKRILKSRSLKIESKIIQDFLHETDLKASLIIIKNEIFKAYTLSNTVLEYVKELPEGEPLDAKKLTEHLTELHNTKFPPSYIDFLVDIVRNYFKVTILDAADFLSGL